jgi:F0F1-type ATP synthase assembly protein I
MVGELVAERKDASGASQGSKAQDPRLTGRYKEMSSFGLAISLAFEFAAAVFLFWFLGSLVDNWLDIEPWAQVTGGVIGWIGGILHVYLAVQRREARESRG